MDQLNFLPGRLIYFLKIETDKRTGKCCRFYSQLPAACPSSTSQGIELARTHSRQQAHILAWRVCTKLEQRLLRFQLSLFFVFQLIVVSFIVQFLLLQLYNANCNEMAQSPIDCWPVLGSISFSSLEDLL